MAEYIEREATCKDCIHYGVCYHIEHYGRELETDKPCEQFKSADAVEVVHASWVWGKVCGSKGYCCTNCGAGFVGENAEWIAKEHDYCPKCGAKMDGERRLKNENS